MPTVFKIIELCENIVSEFSTNIYKIGNESGKQLFVSETLQQIKYLQDFIERHKDKEENEVEEEITNNDPMTTFVHNHLNEDLSKIIQVTNNLDDTVKLKDLFYYFIDKFRWNMKFKDFKKHIIENTIYNNHLHINSSKCNILKGIKMINQNQ
jgi:hypothetical protein